MFIHVQSFNTISQSATTEQSNEVRVVQTNPLNNKMWSNPFPTNSHCLSAHIGIKFSLSIKYGIQCIVKKFIKHIRCILMLFGHRRAGNIGLNLGVAVQTLLFKVCK